MSVFVANPDMTYRIRHGEEIVPPPFSSFYTWEGYPQPR